jgi:hypothetical protein
MQLQLVARVTDPELLSKSIHEHGTLFYQQDTKGNITRIVYFSSSRVIEYHGKVDENLATRVRAEGHQADTVEVDEFQSSVRIVQKSPSD